MSTRLARYYCSRSIILSTLSVLGVMELGRIIMGSDREEYINQQDKKSLNDEVAKDKDIDSKMVYEVTEKATNDTVIFKAKKVVRHKILLLAYARSGSSFTGE